MSRVGTLQFDAESIVGWLIFHALDIAAVLVLAGVFIFLRRRLHDPGRWRPSAAATSSPSPGSSPSRSPGCSSPCRASGSTGRFYSALNTIHALTVILGLMYIPFGKLFHIFQRPGNLGVAYYKRANAEGPAAVCRRCGEGFASAQQVADLQACSPRSASTTRIDGGGNYQDTCPRCRRAQVDAGPVGPGRRVRLMATPPVTEDELDRALRAPPQRGAARRLGRRPRDRQGRRHPLLLLRPAVRHQAEGPRQRGRRVRALVRLPVQRGQALPQGREALPAGQPPRPAAAPDGARPAAPGGFRPVSWDEALDRVVGEIRRIQATYGDDAFAMLSGVSLTNEKSYLIGKFARLALHTANLDYNGRYCMVSAGAGNKKALGIDRAPTRGATSRSPTSCGWPARTWPRPSPSRPATSGGPATGAPSSSCRTRGRAPGPHRGPVPPGAARHRLGAVRRGAARADPQRLARPRVHRRPHRRLRPGRRRGRRHDPGVGGRRSPACPRRASRRPRSGGGPRPPG